MHFIEKLLEKKYQIGILDIFIIILASTLIRTFIERFSNHGSTDFFVPVYFVFFAYFLYFTSAFLFLLIILFCFTKVEMEKLIKFSILFLPVICLPPIIDLLVTKGQGLCMAYLIQPNLKGIFIDFLTFFGPMKDCGLTIGMRIEIFFVCVVASIFIYHITRKKIKALFGFLISYGLIFLSFVFPSFFMLNSPVEQRFFFSNMFNKSLLGSIHTFDFFPSNPLDLFMQQTGIFFARCHWIMIVLSLLIIFYLAYRPLWNAWIRNLRPERILYYSLIAIFGMSISYRVNGSWPTFTLPDILALIVFFTLIILNWCLAVIINDIEDMEIDKISNPDRPLITKNMSIGQFKTIGVILLFLILTGAPLLNYPVFVFLILFQFMYYVYSKKPLYLKKYFFIASPLLAFNALLVAMAGFFLISANQKFLAFPVESVWFILIGFSIFVNIKDFKDYAGDKAAGIKTLPAVFGQEKAKKILAFLIILFLMLFSFYKQSSYLFFSSLIISAAAYIFLNKTRFREMYLFCLFYLYLIIVMLVL